MALRLTAWIGLTVAGCLAAALALVPLQPRVEPSAYVDAPGRTAELAARLRRAYNLHWALATRDTVMRALRGARTASEPVSVYTGRGLPPSLHAGLVRALQPVREVIERNGDDIRVAVAVVLDTLKPPPDLPAQWRPTMTKGVQLPEATDGRTCLIIVGIGEAGFERLRGSGVPHDTMLLRSFWWPARADSYDRGLLGPCGFYGAFGLPGRGVRAWLESADHIPALNARWMHGRSEPPLPIRQPLPRVWWRGSWTWYSGFEPMLAACAARRAEGCRDVVLTPVAVARVFRWVGFSVAEEMSVPGVLNVGRLDRAARHGLGRPADQYLSDLIEEIGPERFRRFWKSDAPVEAAFAEAAGMSLEDWTMRWVRRYVPAPTSGPTPSPISTLLALLMAGGAVAGAAAYAQRRVAG